MKFTRTVNINKPREEVARYFADPQYLNNYQDGFLRKDLVTGTEGHNGAVSTMYYQTKRGEMELTETIITNRLPDTFQSSYHYKHMDNTMKCSFVILDAGKTRYDSEIEYTAIRGFTPKLMAAIFPGMFRKMAQKWLNNFKVFVENQN